MLQVSAARVVTLGLAGIVVSSVGPARAESPQGRSACEASYEQAQVRRQKRELLAAREHLMQCAQAECPQVARNDCANWLIEVERSIPSVILLPRRDGADLVDVLAVVDGKPTMIAPGAPLSLDPGPHRVLVQAGTQERTTSFTLPEGEKLRQLVFEFDAEPTVESPGPDTGSPLFVAGLSAGVGSVLALGVFAGLGAVGLSEESALSACAPDCAREDVDAVASLYVGADVALTAGVVLGATSVGMLLVWGALEGDAAREREAAAQLTPVVAFDRDVAWLGVAGSLP